MWADVQKVPTRSPVQQICTANMSEYGRLIISPVSVADWLLLPPFRACDRKWSKNLQVRDVVRAGGRIDRNGNKTRFKNMCGIKEGSLSSFSVTQKKGHGGSKYALKLKKD